MSTALVFLAVLAALQISCEPNRTVTAATAPIEQVNTRAGPPDADSPTPAADSPAEETHQRMARLFEQERVDAAWAKQHEDALKDAFARVHGTSVRRVECRTTLCRMELAFRTHRDAMGFHRAFRHMAGKHPENMFDATATVQDFDEIALRGTLFITKPGFSIPHADGTAVRFPSQTNRPHRHPFYRPRR
jgi:hypothetical protein